MGIEAIRFGVLMRDSCIRGCTKWLHVGLSKVPLPSKIVLLITGKSGFDVIRFAFKRLPDQPPLVDGKGEVMPEPNFDSEEWKGWEARLTDEHEVLDIKKEESPVPEAQRRRAEIMSPKRSYIKVEEDLNNIWRAHNGSEI